MCLCDKHQPVPGPRGALEEGHEGSQRPQPKDAHDAKRESVYSRVAQRWLPEGLPGEVPVRCFVGNKIGKSSELCSAK